MIPASEDISKGPISRRMQRHQDGKILIMKQLLFASLCLRVQFQTYEIALAQDVAMLS